MDKPISRRGRTSVYGYRHILQILVIKHLQSRGIPLATIRALTSSADNRELELLLPENPGAARQQTGHDVRRMLEASARASQRTGSLEATARSAQATSASTDSPGAEDTWHRIEVGPGLELLVHTALLTEEQRERLRGALLREIGILRGWFGEG